LSPTGRLHVEWTAPAGEIGSRGARQMVRRSGRRRKVTDSAVGSPRNNDSVGCPNIPGIARRGDSSSICRYLSLPRTTSGSIDDDVRRGSASRRCYRCGRTLLYNQTRDRQLELPAWMFERAGCRDCFPLATTPLVSMVGLRALSNLLGDVLSRRATASTASVSSASRASRNQDVGEVRVSQHDETPNEGLARPARWCAAAVRPVRREPAAVGRRRTDMVCPSGRGKKRADRPDDTTDPGAHRSEAAGRGSGGQP